MRIDRSFIVELVDSFTNSTSTHFPLWTKLTTDEVLNQMRNQMSASTLVFLVFSCLVLSFVVAFIIREVYTLFHLKNLKGKVVLITGGASGIGRLIAKRCCQLGSTVVIWDVNEEFLEKTVRDLSGLEGKIYGYKVDITDYQKVYEVADKVKRDVGASVDVLINNAGVIMGKNLLNSSEKEIMLTMNVNTLSHFWTVKAFLPDMIQKKEGHIVTVASACGIAATSGMPDYVASKFAAIGFNDSLRVELKQSPDTVNIKTLCVCPYYINTGMFTGVKNGFLPLLEPEYVADRVVNSIQRCDEALFMPWTIKTSYLFKFIAPIWLQDLGLDVLGVSRSMKTFKGRTDNSHVSTITNLVQKKNV